MSSKTYIGLHPNNLNRTEYGQVVLYVEGEPVAFFSGSGDVVISGSLAIEGITNVSASIAAAIATDTGSFMLTGSVNNDTITFTQGDGTTFEMIINNVTSSLTASYVENAQTASYVETAQTASYVLNAVTASYVQNAESASYTTFAETALTASYVLNAESASYALTAVSASYVQNAETASYVELAQTASYVENAQTASYVENAVSASYVLNAESASYSTFAETSVTASYVQNAESASYATFAETSTTASHAVDALSASYAATASSADAFLVRQDLTVQGTVTAKEFHTEFVSASIIYQSGSTKFGDTSDDTHAFTGSVTVTETISSSDAYINDWGSISASLASLDSGASALTLQDVTDNGSTTTNGITIDNSGLGEYGLTVIANNDYPLAVSSSNLPGDPYLKIGSEGIISVDSHTSKFTLYVSTNGGGTLYRAFEARTTGIYSTGSVSAGGDVNAGERLSIGIVDNATTDLDKFLVIDGSGDVKYRTGAQLASDIQANLLTPTLHQVTSQGNTTTNGIEVGAITTTASASIGTTLNIGTVNNANTDTDKFLVLSLDGGVRYRTGTQVASDIGALTATPNLQAVTDIGATTTNSITAAGLNLTSVSNAGVDTDKFLVLDSSGNVDYRTGAEVLSDIGAGASSLDLQDVTDNGNSTTTAITASALRINGSGEFTGDLTVGGTITAQEFHTEYVSAAVIYESGSTKFGDTANDTHQFTGSVNVLGNIDSTDSYIDDWGSISASLATLQSSAGVSTLQDVTDNGNTTTASITASGANLTSVTNAGSDTDKFLVLGANGSVLFRTGDEIATDIGATTQSFDGNRAITQPLLPDLVDFNPGTSNITDFLEQVFYPDPGFGIEILTNEPFYILESELSSSFVRGATVAGTPPAALYYQYGTASFEANTDVSWSLQTNSVLDIHPTTGQLFIKINLSGSATYQAPKTIAGTVTATATSGGYKTRDFTVTVLDNTGPTIVTNDISNYSPKAASFVTASGAYIGFVYINEATDPAGPPTIHTFGGTNPSLFSSSLFDQPQGASYYNIYTTQALNSGSYVLDYTGSDLYGNEASASVTLVINANTAPELTVYSGFDGNIANYSTGDTYGQITVTDNQGDAIDTFTLSGPDASDFTVQKINSNMGALSSRGQGAGTGTERWAVKFATTPQIGSYNITASATDNFAFTGSLEIDNTLAASTPSLPTPNGTFHIIESALSGDSITTTGTGIAGTAATMTTNQPVSWSLSGDLSGKLAISGSTVGYLTLQGDLSGSIYQYGSAQLSAVVKATNVYNLSETRTITVDIEDNTPATVSTNFSAVNNHFTTASNVTFGTVTVTDPQSYENVQLDSIGGPDASKFQASSESPAQNVVYTISNTQPLNSGSYIINFTSSDSYGQITKTGPVTLTVSPNNPPTITGAPFSKDYSLATTGDTIGTVQVADGDNGVDGIASFSLTGADSSKFSAVFVSTAGNLTKTYNINAAEDLAVGSYNISGSATDGFGFTTVTPLQTTITAAAPAIPDSNAPFYAIESALAGANVTSNSSGIPGTVAAFTTNQTVTWSLTNGIWLDINSSGELSLKINLSGSSKQAGSQINDEVVATNGAGTASTLQFTVNVTNDADPVITNTLANKNNNKTTTATGFGTITISDPQSLGNVTLTDFNGPDVSDFSFNPGTIGSTTVYTVSSSGALNSGSYNFSVTGSDAYYQTASAAFTITVIENLPPTLTQSGFSKTTSQATNGSTIGTIVAADPQDDSISSFTLTGLSSSKFTAVLASSTATSKTYNINSTEDLTPGEYNLTGSATDSFGLSVTEAVPTSITSQAPSVPIQNAVNFYIIESALSSSNVFVSESGYSGVQADMNTDQAVTWSIKSPNTYLAIDTNGGLTIKTNISGSPKNASGAPYNLISEYVVATNEFGGSSEALVNVQVTPNEPPVLSYTGLSVVSGSASANGQTVGTVTATDPQSLDSIDSITISGGTDAAKFALAVDSSTSYSKTYNINTAQDLSTGNYQIELTATDSFNKQTVESKTITVTSPAAAVETVYVYGSTRGAGSLTSTNAAGVLGDPDLDDANILSGSPLEKFKASNIGDATISVGGGTMTRIHTGSLATLTDLDTFGNLNFSNALQQILILFPSGSSIGAQPVAMYDGTLPASSPQSGRFALYDNNATIPGVVSSGVHYFDLDAGQSVDGFSRWGIIYSEAANQNNATFHIIPDSGSAP